MSYRDLTSYQAATVIYDFTVEFCDRYVRPAEKSDQANRSYRMVDQMVQAARSGKQNIAEGSNERFRQSELKLLGVARPSFEELLADDEDFLRQRSLPQWAKDDARTKAIRSLAYKPDTSYQS